MEFLAQGRPVDAEGGGSPALVAGIPVQHFAQQGLFDFRNHEGVQRFAGLRVDVIEIASDGARYALTQGGLQGRILRGIDAQRRNGIHYELAPGVCF